LVLSKIFYFFIQNINGPLTNPNQFGNGLIWWSLLTFFEKCKIVLISIEGTNNSSKPIWLWKNILVLSKIFYFFIQNINGPLTNPNQFGNGLIWWSLLTFFEKCKIVLISIEGTNNSSKPIW
jgi:steroid 5-alpha reductase family enzyme